MNAVDILEAIGEVDDCYIRNARSNENKKRVFTKWIAVAASVALIICAIPFVQSLFGGTKAGGDAHANPLNVGSWYVNTNEDSKYFCTNIYYKSCEDNSITILLEKADNETIYWYLSGRYVTNSWTDENGKPSYDSVRYYTSTNPEYSETGVYVENAFKFIVNGEVSDFPTEKGVYEIVIDFSDFAGLCTELNPYLVCSYEAFYIAESAVAGYPDGWLLQKE